MISAEAGQELSASVRTLRLIHAYALFAIALGTIPLLVTMVSGPTIGVPIAAAMIFLNISAVSAFIVNGSKIERLWARRTREIAQANEAHRHIEELFAMTDMLQAAETYEDSSAVLMATARRLLPDYGAALYVFNNSHDRLDLAHSWDLPEGYSVNETLAPVNCWALKRGKPHINEPAERTLCCPHHASEIPTVEIPMLACGQLHGLLILARPMANGSFAKLKEVRRLGRALADSMSLALSNIALRERLRTQSLRDPLTGLYNRRYMEDALERFLALDARTGRSTSVVMLDLDNFKQLNDKFGHAKGDAVLRDVASQLVGAVRPTDVVCRYGGEELVVILPECPLQEAELKADGLRRAIEMLGKTHGCAITASLGVANVPQTASGRDVLATADRALYAAKTSGKNKVVSSGKPVDAEEVRKEIGEIAERQGGKKAA